MCTNSLQHRHCTWPRNSDNAEQFTAVPYASYCSGIHGLKQPPRNLRLNRPLLPDRLSDRPLLHDGLQNVRGKKCWRLHGYIIDKIEKLSWANNVLINAYIGNNNEKPC